MPFSISSMKYNEAGSGPNSAGEDRQEPERPIRSTQGRNAPAVLLHESQEDSTRRVLIEKQVIHVHRGQLADPLQEHFLLGGILADRGQNRREILALITEDRMTREGGVPYLKWRRIEEPEGPQLFEDR